MALNCHSYRPAGLFTYHAIRCECQVEWNQGKRKGRWRWKN